MQLFFSVCARMFLNRFEDGHVILLLLYSGSRMLI